MPEIQDEIVGMTITERIESINKEAEAFLAPLGMSLCYNLSGKGKLEHKAAVTR